MVIYEFMSKAIIKGGAPLMGDLTPPGDKSISHRAAIIGSLSNGPTTVRGFLFSNDTLSSINAMMSLGIPIESNPEFIRINGKGLFGLSEPEDVIDAGNSGTTARLLTGLLSAQNFFSTISGDKYLRVRPMDRVVEPLRLMGARISGRGGGKRLPLAFEGNKLSGVKYHPPVASSQIKSAILLAGLFAEGETEVIELKPTRDHTERMFSFFGVKVERDGLSIKIRGHQQLEDVGEITVPGDISSATFFIVAALVNPNSEILIKNVGINNERLGAVEVLKRMGGYIEIIRRIEESGEIIGDILVKSSKLRGTEIKGDIIPKTIDELPVIAVAACLAEGETIIKDAKELRVKESDRIKTVVTELSKFGADIVELQDGMIINGKETLIGANCSSWGDHRVAMALAVAGTRATGETEIDDSECVSVSFPAFFDVMKRLRG